MRLQLELVVAGYHNSFELRGTATITNPSNELFILNFNPRPTHIRPLGALTNVHHMLADEC